MAHKFLSFRFHLKQFKNLMMSNNGKDIDLGLSPGPSNHLADTSNNDKGIGLSLLPTNYVVEATRLDENGGAGANATSRTTMVSFDDPLCEIVWSAHSGLNLNKCADSSCADQKPFLMWNVWSEIQKPQKSKSGEHKVIDQDKMIVSPEVLEGISEFGEKGTLFRSSRGSSSCELKEPYKQEDFCGKNAADEEVTSTCGKVIKNQDITPIPLPGPVLNSLTDKGKQKALSDERASNDRQKRAESCNSIRFSSRGVKRRITDEARCEKRKIQIQESRAFPKSVSPSFVSWISTMVKRRQSDCDKIPKDNLRQVRKYDQGSPKSGFHSVFQTLYNPKKSDSKEKNILSSKVANVDPFEKTCGSEKSTRIYTREGPITENQAPGPLISPNANSGEVSAQEMHRFSVPPVFTKIMNALKHILRQRGNAESSTLAQEICFFCGKNGHDLRKCSQLTETELDSLLAKIGEENPRLCLKCFRFDHWASSCPSGKKLIMYDSEELFHAVRKLRLSRTDIVRWMKSDVSLDGFFLRLRLRTSKAGLGGTGYYVARITEDAVENIGWDSKKSIMVDVGGIRSYVGSQYVSNHDFLEEEFEAWLGGMVKAGGKIPSLDELNVKFKHRTCLDFTKAQSNCMK